MNKPCPKGAVAIIGSLWWDNDLRENWRNQRLVMEEALQVKLPIRYGRRSRPDLRRRGTYTMVFSAACIIDRLGQGYLVPLADRVCSFRELLYEARTMWKAEGGDEEMIYGFWGSVALMVNPEGYLPDDIVEAWKRHYTKPGKNRPDYRPVGSEPPIISSEGILRLDWETMRSDNAHMSFDFILAAAIVPNVPRYPSPEEIARKMKERGYTAYFDNNIRNDIRTFQDDEIALHLGKS